MKKIKHKGRKLLVALAILILNAFGFVNSVYATNLDSAHLYSIGECGSLLKYKGIPVKVSYVQYTDQGIEYPAYCLDKTKPGAETGEYTVSINQAIQDVGLWRRVIHGYPYQSMEALGVANKEEAFTATKQAIYCYIHGNNPSDYEAIGEAGERTLRAMKKIIQEAENSHETKISNTIRINKELGDWKQDEAEPNYLTKTFSITASAAITNYKIILKKVNAQDNGGIKITNLKNQEQQEFKKDEKFKVLIPIKNMTQKGNFDLEVTTKIQTKPVLYGVAPNSNYQDYALTAATYEDGNGKTTDEYPQNETKIIIIKQDEKTGEKLENVEFELLDQDKKVVYTGLKTNQEGKIVLENLVPGKYYLKETNAIEGYEKYEELIELEVALQEEMTVTVNNRKEEKPTIKVEKKQSQKEVRKLPVTGK